MWFLCKSVQFNLNSEPDSLRDSESEHDSEPDSESEFESETSPEGIFPFASSVGAENFCGDSPQGIHQSGESLIWWSTTLPRERNTRIFRDGCSHRAILAKHVPSFTTVAQNTFSAKKTSLWILPQKEIFLGSIAGSPPTGKILLFAIPNFPIKFMPVFKDRYCFTKIGEGKSHCLVTNELRKKDSDKDRFLPISETTNSFPEIQGRWNGIGSLYLQASPSPSLIFEGETLYRAPIPVTPSDSRWRQISGSRIFFWVSSEHIMWPNSDLSLIRAAWFSSKDLCQTPLPRELFKSADFGSRFSSGLKSQSSSEGRIKLNIPFFDGCWFAVSSN